MEAVMPWAELAEIAFISLSPSVIASVMLT
jgi:hypothetical protein